MKKWIVTVLMMVGMVSMVGWFIACAPTVQPGVRSRVWGCLDGMEWLLVVVFAVLAIYGLILALKNCQE